MNAPTLLSTVENLEKIDEVPFGMLPSAMNAPIGVQSARSPAKHFISDSVPHRYSPD